MYEIRHQALVFAQKLQKRGLYVVNRPYDICTVFAFYVKIYAHRLVECTIRPIPQYGIISMLRGIQSYSFLSRVPIIGTRRNETTRCLII